MIVSAVILYIFEATIVNSSVYLICLMNLPNWSD